MQLAGRYAAAGSPTPVFGESGYPSAIPVSGYGPSLTGNKNNQGWQQGARGGGGGRGLWEDGNICAGRQAYVTTNVPAASICAGDFSKMIFPTWGEGSPVAIVIDPYTAKKDGKIEILVSLLGDVNVLREEVFCISADSAIQ